MGMVSEFKAFAMKGNVVDLAVGVIIGAAFGKIVSSLVTDVLMPVIGLATGGISFTEKKIELKPAVLDAAGAVTTQAVTLNYGVLIDAIINFLIVAFCLFIVIKAMNAAKKKEAHVPPSAPAAAAASRDPARGDPRPAAQARLVASRSLARAARSSGRRAPSFSGGVTARNAFRFRHARPVQRIRTRAAAVQIAAWGRRSPRDRMSETLEPRPLGELTRELDRLASAVSALEVRLAGSLAPEANDLLARLSGASRHLLAAQSALAGVASEPATRGVAAPEIDHLQGSSRSVPIQDLLCFLSTAKKSGVLRVQSERELFLLQLSQGAVVYAAGDAPPPGEGLVELLAAQGVGSTEVLARLPEGAADGPWFDKNLVGTSWISRESLAGAIQQQTRLSFFRLCAARETRFRFYEGAEIQNVVPVRQSAMELLLEYSRALDERGGAPLAPAPAAHAEIALAAQRRPAR